jgi:hypothetical protein
MPGWLQKSLESRLTPKGRESGIDLRPKSFSYMKEVESG